MSFKTVEIKTANELEALYNNSACTQLGYMPEELHLYVEQLEEQGFLADKEITVYTYSGKTLNEFIGEGESFPNDLHVFTIDLDDMKEIGRFAVTLRLAMGYRWLDDIVNNKRGE